MRISVTLALLGAIAFAPVCRASNDKDTALKFIDEYVRELSTFNEIRNASEKNMRNASDSEKILNMINASEKFQLELYAAIEGIKEFKFPNQNFDQLIPEIVSFYRMKIDLWKQMSDIASQFVAPKEGVDYAALTAEMPKIRARMDYIDDALFRSAPVVFMTLIDFSQKDQSKPVHMLITKADRDNLVRTLHDDFGIKLDLKNQDYEVSTARLLRIFLLKYKCADEAMK